MPRVALYASTIFLAAFLLFLIEPLFAKLILSWFGGTAAVWTTCLVFFQVTLLAGYLYAFGVSRYLRPNSQATVHTVLLAGALLLVPVIPGPQWKPPSSDAPLIRLWMLLIAVLGLPFFLLSTTGPLLQSWLARRSDAAPYRLFALSNAAALLALLAYPVVIEPKISTRTQDVWWSFGFAAFAVLSIIAAWNARTAGRFQRVSSSSDRASRAIWFALAAGGSMLLLSTTNQLTQNVAAVPFLWVLPLVVYLATFILCFEGSGLYRRPVYTRLVVTGFAAVAYMIYDIQLSAAIFVSIPVYLLGLFAGCMFCHGELSARKPSKDDLTAFYLMIAAGGAAGAVFVGLIAPWIFAGTYELAVSLFIVSSIGLYVAWRSEWSQRLLWITIAGTMAIVVIAQARAYHLNAVVVTRNFYGTLRVVESAGVRRLYHGTIEHGAQFLDSRRDQPTTYYGPPSGAGLALEHCCAAGKRVGVIGLGTGTLAAYGRAGDQFRFYEINPQVTALAQSEFSFLKDTAARVEIEPGDARLTLEREPTQNFDVLVVDAFSGDAIPVHLLTREAFAVYRRHLKSTGILAVHVSNQFLDLAPVVTQIAAAERMSAILIQSDKDESRELAAASWVLVTSNTEFLGRAAIANVARSIPPRNGQRLWTDDYNDLFEVIRWFR